MKPQATLLVVDDEETFRVVMSRELERCGYLVRMAASGEAGVAAVGDDVDVVLLDLRLPDMDGMEVLRRIREKNPSIDVIMLTGHGSIDTAIEAIRAGAFDYIAKPCPLGELEVRIQRALERQALRRRAAVLERGLAPPDVAEGFVGESEEFSRMLQTMARVAASSATVLVTGETGSGKEMVAKWIHARSARRARPFVIVECAALQESLLQSELFGHERGAFTGADQAKPGLFEVAHGGTIFLDEIGEVSAATQVKLLRVLDTSTFRHVGGTKEIRVDVRVIAATNRDLEAMVKQGLIREDLYYRMSTITLRVAPLRERRGDIPLLAEHFTSQFNARFGSSKRIGAAAMAILSRHAWPGNVRELLHAIEGAMVVCDGAEILPEHLPPAVRSTTAPPARIEPGPSSSAERPVPTLEQMEREYIELALRRTNGHRGQAATMLGISERNLYRKLRDYGLDQ
jgi:DNA-binding NtrC family response regulator